MQDLAESIEAVDAQGTEGINIRAQLDDLDSELAEMKAKIEAFEAANGITLDTNVKDMQTQPAVRAFQTAPVDGGSLDQLFDIGNRETDVGVPTDIMDSTNIFPDDVPMPSPQDILDRHGGDGESGLQKAMGRLKKQFDSLRDTLGEFDIRMSDIHNLLATLVPLIIVFIGAIPAVVTALVGLAAAAATAAAAMAAIAGFGAMGVALEGGEMDMENLTEVWEDIKESFIEAFAPLAEQLEPLFRDGIDGLSRFFQLIANEGDALMELTDEARAFGGFIMDFVPGALRTLSSLVEALSPILADIGQAINDNFNDWVRELVRLTVRAMPAVSSLIQTLVGAIPAIVEISIQFAKLADAVLTLIGYVWTVVSLGGLLNEMWGLLIATGLVLTTVVALMVKIFNVWSTAAAIASAHAGGFALAVLNGARAALVFAGKGLAAAISAIWGFSMSVASSIPILGSYTVAQYAAAGALAAFITLATLGAGLAIVGLATSAASAFTGLAGSIDSATNSLKEFDRVSGNTTGGFNPYGGNNPPSSGAGAANPGSGQTTINIESSGNRDEDRSNTRYVAFRQGRTTGGTN